MTKHETFEELRREVLKKRTKRSTDYQGETTCGCCGREVPECSGDI